MTWVKLKYGIVSVLVGMTVVGTFFIIDNKKTVEAFNAIALYQAAVERCLSTQTVEGSNVVETVTNSVVSWINNPNGVTYIAYDTNGNPYVTNFLVAVTNQVEEIITNQSGYTYLVPVPRFVSTEKEIVGRFITNMTYVWSVNDIVLSEWSYWTGSNTIWTNSFLNISSGQGQHCVGCNIDSIIPPIYSNQINAAKIDLLEAQYFSIPRLQHMYGLERFATNFAVLDWSDFSIVMYTNDAPATFTYILTNVITWVNNRDLFFDSGIWTDPHYGLDTTIKNLIPYFVNTNVTNSFEMHTVTGLWASLEIGDGTNKFTSVPALTNIAHTDWIVNYTTWFPNQSPTDISYTTDVSQIINYADSWTTTGGYVWVTFTNQNYQDISATTSSPTFGDIGKEIYEINLIERYKLLYEMQVSSFGVARCWGNNEYNFTESSGQTNWANAVAEIISDWPDSIWDGSRKIVQAFPAINYGQNVYNGLYWDERYHIAAGKFFVTNLYVSELYTPYDHLDFYTGVAHNVQFWYLQCTNPLADWYWGVGNTEAYPLDYDISAYTSPYGFPSSDPGWHLLNESGYTDAADVNIAVTYGYPLGNPPPECDEPIVGLSHQLTYTYEEYVYTNIWAESRGGPAVQDARLMFHWLYNYCTNKFW